MTDSQGIKVPGILAWPLMAGGVLGLMWAGYFVGQRTSASRFVTAGPRIEEVRRIAKLAVLRVQVADIIQGNTAGASGAVLVKGDADMVVDLDRVQIVDRDDRRRTATLVIPTPHADRPRVDHRRTRVYELRKTGLALINPFADPRADLLADAMRAAQEQVERAVQDADFVAQAKEQAERLLVGFYRELGWELSIRWE